MGIYIKGMKVPKKCGDCFGYDRDYQWCRILWSQTDWYTKDACCPLLELPPHARLIDADVAYDCIAEEDHAGNYVDMDSVGRGIENTPTVIEAEECE